MIKEISLPISDLSSYVDVGKDVYPVSMYIDDEHFTYSLLRSSRSRSILDDMVRYMITSSLKFNINSGLDEIGLSEEEQRTYTIEIRPFIVGGNDESNNIPYTYPITSTGDISPAKYVNTRAEEFFNNNNYYNNKFPFIIKHISEFLGIKKTVKYWKDPVYETIDIFQADPGLVISFNKFKADANFLNVNYNDVRTLEAMNKIQNYSIITPDVVLANLYAREELIKGSWQNVEDASDVIWFKDNKVSPLVLNNNIWTIKQDDSGDDEVAEYTLKESCENTMFLEDTEEETTVAVKKKGVPNYLNYKNMCWTILSLSKNSLILKSNEFSETKKYKKVNFSPAKKTSTSTKK